jgi:hypothetical protein
VRRLKLEIVHFSDFWHEGHQALAEAARSLLLPQARAGIARLLGNDDLAQIATWADLLKQVKHHGKHQGSLAQDREAASFNAKFPQNAKWHFLDLPLGSKAYSDTGKFSRDEDIVHEINECIRILETHSETHSKTRSAPVTRFEKKQALRFLVHLVGDIHQPLHVGTGYYDLSKSIPALIEDPERADHRPDDKGGNALLYGTNHYQELHAYWDDILVEKIAHTARYEQLALVLESDVKSEKNQTAWLTSGDYHLWAESWATDSVHEARHAYEGIQFDMATVSRRGKIKLIRIRLPETYERDQLPRARAQLSKAAYHLALLLNRIRW